MRKIVKVSILVLFVIFLYRLFFCYFLIDLSNFHKNVFCTPLKVNYPDGILSPIAKNKVEKPIIEFLNKNKSEPYVWYMDSFEIVSIIDNLKNNETKEVLISVGKGEKSTYILFYIKGNEILKSEIEK